MVPLFLSLIYSWEATNLLCLLIGFLRLTWVNRVPATLSSVQEIQQIPACGKTIELKFCAPFNNYHIKLLLY